MYFVNWQREISISEVNGKKVVIKRNKTSKNLHDYILVISYSVLSILLAHPSAPPEMGGKMTFNEGFEMREKLQSIGISTPKLISITSNSLTEEFISGGNLYEAFLSTDNFSLAFAAGIITGRLHKYGYSFIDNKSQNYLVSFSNNVIRTDLAFIQKKDSIFAKSMDIGSFLGSLISLDREKYRPIQDAFCAGYCSETKNQIPYLSIALRNFLGLGLGLSLNWIKNNLESSEKLISYRRKFGFSVKSP